MATAVFNRETIELLDGSSLELKALSLRNRRKFMAGWDELVRREPVEGEERSLEDNENDLLGLIPYCVAGQRPEWEGVWSSDEEQVSVALDAMAEALDEDTLYYIIKKTVGLDLKAMAQMTVDLMKAESAGTN